MGLLCLPPVRIRKQALRPPRALRRAQAVREMGKAAFIVGAFAVFG